MVVIYNVDIEKSYDNITCGQTFYKNQEGKIVYTETWSKNNIGINPNDNLKYYMTTSTIQIQNLPKFNGIYISNYFYNENYAKYQTQKELVVYYTGVTNKCRIKVTYIDLFSKVMVECSK